MEKTLRLQSYELYWQPWPEKPPVRVWSQIYDAEAMAEAEAEIQQIVLEVQDDEDYERIVATSILGLDSRHLADFGIASPLPFYAMLGSRRKYKRGFPAAGGVHHMCYAPGG